MIIVADQPRGGFNPAQNAILDRFLGEAGMVRTQVTLLSPDQWAPWMWDNQGAIVLAGEYAALKVLGWSAPPDNYHGSILPKRAKPPQSWENYVSWCVEPAKVLVTYSIENVHKMYAWHPLATRDWWKAGRIEAGEDFTRYPYRHVPADREWILNQPEKLMDEFSHGLFAFDTEFGNATIFGVANERKVQVLFWSPNMAKEVGDLMKSPALKIAHNLQHDMTMCEMHFDSPVSRPYLDTMGEAHTLNTELEKSLSPGISARFTFWPYHKWLYDVDSFHYNGMDNVVCFDAHLEMANQISERGLNNVIAHDHDLLEVLYGMQQQGLLVDSKQRKDYENQVRRELVCLDRATQASMRPIVHAKISRFKKPHLFLKQRKCPCCGGGTLQRIHCERCGHPRQEQSLKAWKSGLPVCSRCNATGKISLWRNINPGSDDQVADILYRGLGIPPRKYKGVETTRADALAKLADKYPLVKQVVDASKVRADLSTVERLTPDRRTGKLHSVFNPWGTVSGRVASSEGLLRAGTNLMNIPKPARRFVVPTPGYIFLYPDMSQIEARVVAILSKPWGHRLWDAFKTPVDWPNHPKHGIIDSHTSVQQMVSRWVEITRDQAKRLTHAAMYGVSAAQLAVELTAEAFRHGGTGFVTVEQAEAILQAFFLAFPEVRAWQDSILVQIEESRTVKSITGRERHWAGRVWDKKKKCIFRETAKEGWSFIPQDTAAWILANGLMRLHRHNQDHRYPKIDLLVHVHDAGLMQCALADLEPAKLVATQALTCNEWGMDFPCAMKTGMNWFEATG